MQPKDQMVTTKFSGQVKLGTEDIALANLDTFSKDQKVKRSSDCMHNGKSSLVSILTSLIVITLLDVKIYLCFF